MDRPPAAFAGSKSAATCSGRLTNRAHLIRPPAAANQRPWPLPPASRPDIIARVHTLSSLGGCCYPCILSPPPLAPSRQARLPRVHRADAVPLIMPPRAASLLSARAKLSSIVIAALAVRSTLPVLHSLLFSSPSCLAGPAPQTDWSRRARQRPPASSSSSPSSSSGSERTGSPCTSARTPALLMHQLCSASYPRAALSSPRCSVVF
mmetsp:Transcript_30032/g.77806  ORF Transcript_30032/g.77806 Transcript_30032/m.77806 type:complete len:207 (-) Transcript_30032:144-764(-)